LASKLKITDKAQIPGLTSPRQHNWYRLLAKRLNKSANVLEVGCGYGKSTWAWLDALPLTTNFYVLDAFVLPPPYSSSTPRALQLHYSRQFSSEKVSMTRKYLKKHFNADQKTVFYNVIQQHPKFNLIKDIFDSKFHEWRKTNNIKFDLVYLDGDHNYDEVSNQLKYFSDCPCICGDDYLWPSVSTAVDEFVQINNYKLETVNEFFIIYT